MDMKRQTIEVELGDEARAELTFEFDLDKISAATARKLLRLACEISRFSMDENGPFPDVDNIQKQI